MATNLRKPCRSLELLCRIRVIEIFHERAANLESDYLERWLEDELTWANRQLERTVDIRDLNPASVVEEYKVKKVQKIRSSRNNTKKKWKNGIPFGVPALDYIRFRKCQYVEDVKVVRHLLCDTLNGPVVDGLMETLHNIARYNCKEEEGMWTLQSMLMTCHTSNLSITNFMPVQDSPLGNLRQPPQMETRIETTILHYTLLEGSRLTRLSFGGHASDSLLLLVSQICTNLLQLNISGSFVSDLGLFHLCGLEKRQPRLVRACKKPPEHVCDKTGLVRNEVPRLLVKKAKMGCLNLNHLEANDLVNVRWPFCLSRYFECSNVPIDSGFVALLVHLKELRILLTSLAGRTVQAYVKLHQKLRKPAPPLNKLQVISESRMTGSLAGVLCQVAPNLVDVRVHWHDPLTAVLSEGWLEELPKFRHIKEVHVKNVDFRTQLLHSALPACGGPLVVMDLREMSHFKYSFFRLIKTSCPSLRHLTLAMTTTNLITTVAQIEVEKDLNLEVYRDHKAALKHLESLHVSGPFGNDVVKYLLRGANDLQSLWLGIDWLDPAFCTAQPSGRTDMVGQEYLEEVLTINNLQKLSELHMSAKYRRGRHHLSKSCADFVMDKFGSLRHLGNFRYWDMSRQEKQIVIQQARMANRNVVFDEDLQTNNLEAPMLSFARRYVEDRHLLSCADHVSQQNESSGFLSDFFEVLAGPQELFEDVNSDSDDSFLDEEDEDDSDDDINNDVNIEPICAVM